MIQGRSRLCLQHKAPPPLSTGNRIRPQHLDRHRPVKMSIEGTIHHAHAALAELEINPVMTELLANHSDQQTDPPSLP